jgi:IMP cyclohydrolase
MQTENIESVLSNNSYPGRGIIIGCTPNGQRAVIAYFIMGRSINSRNRIFENTSDGIRTKAFDPSKLSDPTLVIYNPVRVLDNCIIVTNGDQTDTIYDFITNGKTFEDALRTRTFEPDDPNFTPRISGIVEFGGNEFSYKLSILKSSEGNQKYAQKYYFDYVSEPGIGHFIHTYAENGSPRIPSFDGEPERIRIDDDIDEYTEKLWNNLNLDNKVSLYVNFVDKKSMETETRIVNKNK